MSPLNRFMANSLKLGCFSNEKDNRTERRKEACESIDKVGDRLESMSMPQQNQIDTYRFGIVYP